MNACAAKKEGYDDYDKKKFPRDSSIIYGFTGLRGDAKELYKKIKSGEEKRVQIVEAPTAEEQEKYVNEADIVIWATGYQTAKMPIFNQKNQKIKLSSQNMFENTTLTQYDVDDLCRIYHADGQRTFSRMYGVGVGYPQRRSDGMSLTQKESEDYQVWFYKYPKVDSFDLYRNWVGSTVLNRVYPKKKLDGHMDSHFIHLNEDHCIVNAQNQEYQNDKKRFENEGGIISKGVKYLQPHRFQEYVQNIYYSTSNIFAPEEPRSN